MSRSISPTHFSRGAQAEESQSKWCAERRRIVIENLAFFSVVRIFMREIHFLSIIWLYAVSQTLRRLNKFHCDFISLALLVVVMRDEISDFQLYYRPPPLEKLSVAAWFTTDSHEASLGRHFGCLCISNSFVSPAHVKAGLSRVTVTIFAADTPKCFIIFINDFSSASAPRFVQRVSSVFAKSARAVRRVWLLCAGSTNCSSFHLLFWIKKLHLNGSPSSSWS